MNNAGAAKPKLTVLLGAGSSVSFGLPGTGDLTTRVFDALKQAEQTPLLSSTVGPDRTELLHEHLKSALGSALNFEHVLHALEAIQSLDRTWRAGTRHDYKIIEGILAGGPAGPVTSCFDEHYKYLAVNAVFTTVYESLVAASAKLTNHSAWNDWVTFVKQLTDTFDVTFATTNYDHVLEEALAFTPEDEGFFQIRGETAWRFNPRPGHRLRLLHLHGNIRFGHLTGDRDDYRWEDSWEDLYWYQDHKEAFETWLKGSNGTSGAGQALHVGPIITGLHKPSKLLVEPYRTYSEAFSSALFHNSRLLVVGYGFGDPHLNYVLRRMGKWHGQDRRIAYVGYQQIPIDIGDIADRQETFGCWRGGPPELERLGITMSEPYIPNGSGSGNFRAWFSGLTNVLKSHQPDLLKFLS